MTGDGSDREALVAEVAEVIAQRTCIGARRLAGHVEPVAAETARALLDGPVGALWTASQSFLKIAEDADAAAARAGANAREVSRLRAVVAEQGEALSRVRYLFASGPDTPCRTTWPNGVECVEVPMDDLRAALLPRDGGGA